MRRIVMVLGTMMLAAACGGEAPTATGAWPLRVAPLWMTELDLPGCEAVHGTSARLEALTHPLDEQLALVVDRGAPTCVCAKSSLQQIKLTSDDPIPLVRESSSEDDAQDDEVPEGEAEDDPIPIVRVAHGPVGDDPIPLVRERDLGGERAALAPAGPR